MYEILLVPVQHERIFTLLLLFHMLAFLFNCSRKVINIARQNQPTDI